MEDEEIARDRQEELRKIVNDSGFPLQFALSEEVSAGTHLHGWEIASDEHPWQWPLEGASGFIDLVLERGRDLLVLECKRVRGAAVVFLVTEADGPTVDRVRCVSQEESSKSVRWMERYAQPTSWEARACAVNKKGGRGKPPTTIPLDDIARQLVPATFAFAYTHAQLRFRNREQAGAWASVIVTTAPLVVCRFDPRTVSRETGELGPAVFEEVPFIRYRKSLAAESEIRADVNFPRKLAELAERTVFVVRASNLMDFLKQYRSRTYR